MAVKVLKNLQQLPAGGRYESLQVNASVYKDVEYNKLL